MVTRKKSIVFFAACLIVSLIFSAFAIIVEPAKATDGAATPTFETYATTVSGASAKMTTGNTGLRFRYSMTKTQYETFQNGEDTVTYGMIIAPLDYNTENAITAESVFGADNVYTFAGDERNQEGKTAVINVCGSTLVENPNNAEEYFFNGAITKIYAENYTRKFIGVGYIAIQSAEGVTTYYFANNQTCVDNARTISYVSETAIENKVLGASDALSGFVTAAYESLAIPETIDSDEDYTKLENAIKNGIVTGFGKSYTLTNNVSESKYVYAGENMPKVTFTYPHYDNVIEDFNNVASRVSAIGKVGDTLNKNYQNETAEWLETYQGKYGVLKFDNVNYDSTYKRQKYYFKSSIRNDTFYVNNFADWDYISVWINVGGANGEKVTVYSKDGDGATVVTCNEWTEFKISKENAKLFAGSYDYGATNIAERLACDKNANWVNTFLSIASDNDDPRAIYLDRVSYEKDFTLSYTGTVAANSELTLSAKVGNVTEGFKFSVKVPNTDNFVEIQGNKYTLTTGGNYIFKTTYTENGVTRTATANATIHDANEIDGFHTADSVIAAFGLNNGGNPAKGYHNDTAEWLEKFEGKYGVLKLNATRIMQTENSAEYHIKSSFRDASFYSTEETADQITAWDYISIWMYVSGTEGEKVTVGQSRNLDESVEVNCNEWFEFKISKKLALAKISKVDGVQLMSTLAKKLSVDNTSETWVHSLIGIDGTTDRTIYLDSISYEKNVETQG